MANHASHSTLHQPPKTTYTTSRPTQPTDLHDLQTYTTSRPTRPPDLHDPQTYTTSRPPCLHAFQTSRPLRLLHTCHLHKHNQAGDRRRRGTAMTGSRRMASKSWMACRRRTV